MSTRRGLHCVQSSITKNVTSELEEPIYISMLSQIFRPNQYSNSRGGGGVILKTIQNTAIEYNCNPKYLLTKKKIPELLPDLPSFYLRVFLTDLSSTSMIPVFSVRVKCVLSKH